MRLIKGSRIQTSNGIYKCVGVWLTGKCDIDSYELIKEYSEPQLTEIVTISYELFCEKLKSKQISVL